MVLSLVRLVSNEVLSATQPNLQALSKLGSYTLGILFILLAVPSFVSLSASAEAEGLEPPTHFIEQQFSRLPDYHYHILPFIDLLYSIALLKLLNSLLRDLCSFESLVIFPRLSYSTGITTQLLFGSPKRVVCCIIIVSIMRFIRESNPCMKIDNLPF